MLAASGVTSHYSIVSNNRAGWNKRVGGHICLKLIIVQVGFNHNYMDFILNFGTQN